MTNANGSLVLGLGATLGLLVCAACLDTDAKSPGSSGPVVRDSAGIMIVENDRPRWSGTEAWVVDPSPLLELDNPIDDPSSTVGRVDGVTRRSDGVIIVADGLGSELKLFTPDGRWQRTIGGSGDGPGEFRSLSALDARIGDSVRVYDPRLRRLAVFEPSGQFARGASIPNEVNARFAFALGWLRDGSLILQAPPPAPPANYGPDLTFGPTFLVTLDGKASQSLGSLPAAYVATDGERKSVPVFPRPFPVAAVDADGIWVGTGLSSELRHLQRDGLPDRIVRWRSDEVSISPAFREALAATHRMRMQGLPSPPAIIRDALPTFSSLLADAEGNVWARQPRVPEEQSDPAEWLILPPPGGSFWTVLSAGGEWLGSVEMPEGLMVQEIGEDYVLGVWKDSLDVDHVRLHVLAKPGSATRR